MQNLSDKIRWKQRIVLPGEGVSGSAGLFLGVGLFHRIDEARQFLDRAVDVIALATQQRDTLLAFLDRDQALQLAAVADVVKVDHLTDVGEAEAGALGAQYPGEPCPVTLRIDARQTLARRADQPLGLIEAQRAR